MEHIRLLICDEDKEYVHALVLYLIGSNLGFSITSHTALGSLDEDGEYDIGLMTARFIEHYNRMSGTKPDIRVILHLSDSSEAVDGYEAIYKFQSMVSFVEKIMTSVQNRRSINTLSMDTSRMISILSPAHHELLLPYAITVSRILSESGRTLLVDLEQCSVLPTVMGKAPTRDLMDLLYLMSSGTLDEIPDEYLGYYDGFYYLSPARMSLHSNSGMRDIWHDMFEFLGSLDFENIVVLYDAILPGMETLIAGSGEIFLVNKPGEFFSLYEREYMQMFEEAGISDKVKKISIPQSAGNLTMDKNILAPVILSALSTYFRKEAKSA